MQPDLVRHLACYSANLVALRASLEPNGDVVPLTKLLRTEDDVLGSWRSMAMLWKAGLDADGLQSMLNTLRFSKKPVGIADGHVSVRDRFIGTQLESSQAINEIYFSQLMNDPAAELRSRG